MEARLLNGSVMLFAALPKHEQGVWEACLGAAHELLAGLHLLVHQWLCGSQEDNLSLQAAITAIHNTALAL